MAIPTPGSFIRKMPVKAASSPSNVTKTLPMFVPNALPAHRRPIAISISPPNNRTATVEGCAIKRRHRWSATGWYSIGDKRPPWGATRRPFQCWISSGTVDPAVRQGVVFPSVDPVPIRRRFSPSVASPLSTSGRNPSNRPKLLVAARPASARASPRRTRLAPGAPLGYIRAIRRAWLAVAGAERGLTAPSHAPFSHEKERPPQTLSKGRRDGCSAPAAVRPKTSGFNRMAGND